MQFYGSERALLVGGKLTTPKRLKRFMIAASMRLGRSVLEYDPSWEKLTKPTSFPHLLSFSGDLETFKNVLKDSKSPETIVETMIKCINSKNPIFSYIRDNYSDLTISYGYFNVYQDLHVWSFMVEHFTDSGLNNAHNLALLDDPKLEHVQVIFREIVKRKK